MYPAAAAVAPPGGIVLSYVAGPLPRLNPVLLAPLSLHPGLLGLLGAHLVDVATVSLIVLSLLCLPLHHLA